MKGQQISLSATDVKPNRVECIPRDGLKNEEQVTTIIVDNVRVP